MNKFCLEINFLRRAICSRRAAPAPLGQQGQQPTLPPWLRHSWVEWALVEWDMDDSGLVDWGRVEWAWVNWA